VVFSPVTPGWSATRKLSRNGVLGCLDLRSSSLGCVRPYRTCGLGCGLGRSERENPGQKCRNSSRRASLCAIRRGGIRQSEAIQAFHGGCGFAVGSRSSIRRAALCAIRRGGIRQSEAIQAFHGGCGFAADSQPSIRGASLCAIRRGGDPKGGNPEGVTAETRFEIQKERLPTAPVCHFGPCHIGPLHAREGCLILHVIRLQRYNAAHRASCNAGFEIRCTRRQPR
jgi:hypothetical protein